MTTRLFKEMLEILIISRIFRWKSDLCLQTCIIFLFFNILIKTHVCLVNLVLIKTCYWFYWYNWQTSCKGIYKTCNNATKINSLFRNIKYILQHIKCYFTYNLFFLWDLHPKLNIRKRYPSSSNALIYKLDQEYQ